MFKFSTMRLYLPTLYIFCWYEEISGSRQRESRKNIQLILRFTFAVWLLMTAIVKIWHLKLW